jgi:hypothetical protein
MIHTGLIGDAIFERSQTDLTRDLKRVGHFPAVQILQVGDNENLSIRWMEFLDLIPPPQMEVTKAKEPSLSLLHNLKKLARRPVDSHLLERVWHDNYSAAPSQLRACQELNAGLHHIHSPNLLAFNEPLDPLIADGPLGKPPFDSTANPLAGQSGRSVSLYRRTSV